MKGNRQLLQGGVLNAQWPPPSADTFVRLQDVPEDWFWSDEELEQQRLDMQRLHEDSKDEVIDWDAK